MTRLHDLRRSPSTLALAALAVALVVVAVIVVGPADPASGSRERIVSVRRGVVQSTVSGTGNLQPAHQVDLDFQTSGRVKAIYVKAGEHVSAGQLLARIDDSSQRVAVAQAKADLATAKDQLASAQGGGATASAGGTANASASAGGVTTANASATAGGGATTTASATARATVA
ncbi:biotin/lipoyl-binding protein, partial [Patulibacter medicamentivorans]|uniref:biotin/lipoyl-binding protein n=1 Tax=Patulibacter medicamentivorans TaxID=1097667 RepID=UPI00058EFAE1